MASLTGEISVAEREGQSALEGRMTVSSAANDTLTGSITVAELDIMAQPWRFAGIELELDRGEGALARMKLNEIGGQIALQRSLEGFGVGEMSFSRLGTGQSQLQSAFLRGARRTRLTGIRGVPGGVRKTLMFDGHLRDGTNQWYPPASEIVAQDGRWLAQPLFYTVAYRSHRTRKDIVTEVCNIARGSIGSIDMANDGGRIVKEINEAGDRSVGQFLSDFLTPTGCRIRLRADGKLEIRKFDTTGTPVRTLRCGDLGESNVSSPSTTEPNVMRFVSNIYAYTGPSGVRVEGPITVDTPGPYTPVVATHKQDKTTGAITSVSPATSAQPTLSSVVTTTTYNGGSVTNLNIKYYGWFAPYAANRKQNADGSTTWQDQIDVYKFPDLTWRTVDKEQWLLLKELNITRTFDAVTHLLVRETETQHFYQRWTRPFATLNAGLAEVFIAGAWMTDDGRAWNDYRQNYGHITTINRWDVFDANTARVMSRWISGQHHATTYFYHGGQVNGNTVFGPTSNKRYCHAGTAAAFSEVWRSFYTYLSETSHRRQTVQTYPGAGDLYPFQLDDIADIAAAEDVTVPAFIPRIEILTDYQVPDQSTILVKDMTRIAANGGVEIQMSSPIQNDYCETRAEQLVAAIEAARDLWSPRIPISKDLDWELGEGSVVALNHPHLGYGDVNALIETSEWALGIGEDGIELSQSIECRADTPEFLAVPA